MIALGSVQIELATTGHGPEITIRDSVGHRDYLTVMEFEHVLAKLRTLVETARAQATARVRQLPMRRT